MSDEVIVKKKVVKEEFEVVEMNIEISKRLYDEIVMAKADVAEKRGYDVTMGEYIEEAFDDLVKMVTSLSQQLQKVTSEQYNEQMPKVVEKEPEPGTHVVETEAPEGMYIKTTNKEINDPMFG